MFGLRPDFRADFRQGFRAKFRPINSDLRPDFRADVRPDFRADFRPDFRADFRSEFRADFRVGSRLELQVRFYNQWKLFLGSDFYLKCTSFGLFGSFAGYSRFLFNIPIIISCMKTAGSWKGYGEH